MIQFNLFKSYPELTYGLSERSDGNMSVKPLETPEKTAEAWENRKLFFERIGSPQLIFSPFLMHGKEVAIIDDSTIHEQLRVDSGVTNLPEHMLTITEADCLPLYVYDPVKKVVGLARAGWRGTVAGVAPETVKKFVQHFGSQPQDVLLGIGPCIQQHHFTVKDDIIDSFSEYQNFIQKGEGEYNVDLPGIVARQVNNLGVTHVEASPICTYCAADIYFSFRRDKPKLPEVMVAYIMLSK